jgi:glutathione S-transferase
LPSVRTLYGLGYSPWSERARWALEHHHLPYRYREHLPLVASPWLRLRGRRPLGRVSVPFLEDDAGARVFDSVAIARYAERCGTGPRLFPEGSERDVHRAVAEADLVLAVARARVIARVRNDPEAQREAAPAFVPAQVASALAPVARATASLLARKYGAPAHDDASVAERMVPRLAALSAALDGREYVTGAFTFADVVVASMLQCVTPVEHPSWVVGPATRRAWTEPALAERFADLLAYRDRVYARHRAPPS